MSTRILALETSGMSGSVAALIDGKLVLERDLDPSLRSAQSLAPGMKRLLADLGWRLREIDCIAVTIGPGSFTGLRVGVTTAKTLAYSTGCQVIGIDTLTVLAQQALNHALQSPRPSLDQSQRLDKTAATPSAARAHPDTPPEITPVATGDSDKGANVRIEAVMDALRGDVFSAAFEFFPAEASAAATSNPMSESGLSQGTSHQPPWPVLVQAPSIISIDDWLTGLQPGTLITGPILNRIAPRLATVAEAGVAQEGAVARQLVVAHSTTWSPRAATVGQIAHRLFSAGTRHDLWSLTPLYLRRSAAEEKLATGTQSTV